MANFDSQKKNCAHAAIAHTTGVRNIKNGTQLYEQNVPYEFYKNNKILLAIAKRN